MPKNKEINWVSVNKKSYDKIAREFSFSRCYVWKDSQVFMKYIKSGNKVLDLGCGNGRLVDLLLQKKLKYTGVDNSKNLVKNAQRNYPKLNFKVMDALDLTFKPKSFDAVLSVSVLNHLSAANQRKYFEEANRVLKPKGYLLLSNWNLWNSENKKGINNFGKLTEKLSDEEFVKKFSVKKSSLGPKDILTSWGDSSEVLYYYAFDLPELKKLALAAGFKFIAGFYSKNGRKTLKSKGDNIVLILRKS